MTTIPKIHLLRADATHPDFRRLVALLDIYLAEKDGDNHSFYNQFNQISHISHVLVAYINDIPAGCGAIKEYDEQTMEIKRMFVHPEFRGRGMARQILEELEKWTATLRYSSCILETGIRQAEAIRLYQSTGYRIISNYAQYAGVEDSICMQKDL